MYNLYIMSNKSEFVLKIYNIPGKNIVDEYITKTKKKLDDLSLNYKIQSITEKDNKFEYDFKPTNNASNNYNTFPFNYFEKFFYNKNPKPDSENLIKNEILINDSNNVNNVIITIFDNEFDSSIGGLKQLEYWLRKRVGGGGVNYKGSKKRVG